MYAVLRVRGLVRIKEEVAETLRMMRLHRKMHCVLVREDESSRGMLQKTKDFITWGTIDDDTLRLLIRKRGRKTGNERLSDAEAEVIFDTVKKEEMIKDINVKPVFRLNPPTGGFKHSIKQHYPKGELGYRAEKMNDLLKRMI